MKKGIKILCFSILLILLLFFVVQWWLGNEVRKLMEEKVALQIGEAVQVHIREVNVRLIGRKVVLEDIRVVSDSNRLVEHDTSFYSLNVFVPRLEVKGIHFAKRDSVRWMRVRDLDVEVAQMEMMDKRVARTGGESLREQLVKLAVNLEIERVHIQADRVQYERREGIDTIRLMLRKMRFQVDRFELNAIPDSLERWFSCENLTTSVRRLDYLFADQSMVLQVDQFYLGTKEGYISIDSLGMFPQYPKEVFALKTRTHSDWTELKTGKISCRGFDFGRFLEDEVLSMDSVSIRDVRVSSFKNRKIEQKKRVKRLFYESVQQFPCKVDIQKVNVEHIRVFYEELSKHGDLSGVITFDSLSGEFQGLTNVVESKQPYFTLIAQGKIMNQGEVKMAFQLPVDPANDHFKVEGKLDKMSMLLLNRMIEPLVKVKIKSGEINEMDFRISGGSKYSSVSMLFLYDDFAISVLKEKDHQLKEAFVITNIMNGVFVKESNPDKRGTRRVEAEAERDLYRSQFNYLWRSVFAGIKATVGIGQGEVRRLKHSADRRR